MLDEMKKIYPQNNAVHVPIREYIFVPKMYHHNMLSPWLQPNVNVVNPT
jgi:hypothetical protein